MGLCGGQAGVVVFASGVCTKVKFLSMIKGTNVIFVLSLSFEIKICKF